MNKEHSSSSICPHSLALYLWIGMEEIQGDFEELQSLKKPLFRKKFGVKGEH